MKRRVVVTGLGAVTPIGNDVESFWNGLKEKKYYIVAMRNHILYNNLSILEM